MAELTSQERLQPSLLDRLTDDEPENFQEGPDKRQLSLNQLKASVLRDLTWLLNATALFSGADNLVANNPAASSVLNYGLPALAGRSASSVEIKAIEKLITDAIVTYEPRILRDTLRVTARVAPGQMNHNALSFRIEGDLWAQPLPLRLMLQTDLDLETGHVQVIHDDTRRSA